MNRIDFTFSDTIAGYVTAANAANGTFTLRTPGGSEFQGKIGASAYAEFVRNLGEPYQDATGQMGELLQPNQYVFAYGIYYPEGGDHKFEAKHLIFPGRKPGELAFEKQDWWINQIRQIGDFYIKAQFEGQEIDYNNYRTNLFLDGSKMGSGIQETDTISRTVYGFASAFLLTGEDRFLEAAEKGTRYLQEKICKRDKEREGIVYWLHALDVQPSGVKEVLGSLFGDDYGRSRPTSRSTRSPAPSRPTASPAIPASSRTRRRRSTSLIATTSTADRPAATTPTSRPTPSTRAPNRWRTTGHARTGTPWATTRRPT